MNRRSHARQGVPRIWAVARQAGQTYLSLNNIIIKLCMCHLASLCTLPPGQLRASFYQSIGYASNAAHRFRNSYVRKRVLTIEIEVNSENERHKEDCRSRIEPADSNARDSSLSGSGRAEWLIACGVANNSQYAQPRGLEEGDRPRGASLTAAPQGPLGTAKTRTTVIT